MATIGLFGAALLPMMAAVPPEPATSPLDAKMPMAIAQPLGAMSPAAIVPAPAAARAEAILPEPGMLVLVGAALLGLAAVVRKTT